MHPTRKTVDMARDRKHLGRYLTDIGKRKVLKGARHRHSTTERHDSTPKTHTKLSGQRASTEGMKKKPRSRPRKRKASTTTPSFVPRTPNLLMKLPAELRNRIYDDVLEDFVRSTRRPYSYSTVIKSGKRKQPGILMVSEQVRSETLPMYYAKGRFELRAKVSEIAGLHRFLNATVRDCGKHYDDNAEEYRGPFNSWTKLELRKCKWTDLASLLPLAKLVADHPLSFDFEEEERDSKRNWRRGRGFLLPNFVQEVAELGLRAYQEKWNATQLELAYDEWLENTLDIKQVQWALHGRLMTSSVPGDVSGMGMYREDREVLPGERSWRHNLRRNRSESSIITRSMTKQPQPPADTQKRAKLLKSNRLKPRFGKAKTAKRVVYDYDDDEFW